MCFFLLEVIGVAMKSMKPCASPMCPNLTKERYCNDHQDRARQEKAERDRYYDRYQRDKRSTAFYKTKSWEAVREEALRRDKGLCQHCLKRKRINYAEMVDHIIPIRIDWSLRLTMSNLQALCNKCHAIKTAEDKRKYGE